MQKIRKHPTYRGATHTQSVLTITSNVVYGKATGNTPDGRRKGNPSPLEPIRCTAATAMAAASCLSVAKLPYRDARRHQLHMYVSRRRRISQTRNSSRPSQGHGHVFRSGEFHIELNVIDRNARRRDEATDKNPRLTMRVSGYAVNFVRLTREQQRDPISRTFHGQA